MTPTNSNDLKLKQFAKAIFKVIDTKYKPTHAIKIKIDHGNISKDLKQKCAAHPYNVLGWALTTFEKGMVGKKNWKTDFIPFLWIKVAEKEGKYQHGYAILCNVNHLSEKIQSALDKAREQLFGTIDMSLVKINSVADLEIEPSLISYVDAEGNAKLRNVVSAKVILGINEDKS
ncbi:MAG: hypothetical protein VZR95_05215 [Alphaproteobacteria bacterium]